MRIQCIALEALQEAYETFFIRVLQGMYRTHNPMVSTNIYTFNHRF